jgi:hexosaminidase
MRRDRTRPFTRLAAGAAALLVAMVACADDSGGSGGDDGDDGSDAVASTTTTGPPPPPPAEPVVDGSFDALIPRPSSWSPADGRFVITPDTVLAVDDDADAAGAAGAAELLRTELARLTGADLDVTGPDGGDKRVADVGGGVAIEFTTTDDDALGDEGYRLDVTPERVRVEAAAAAGFGWAVQTMVQGLPPGEPTEGSFALPAGTLRDSPAYPWRGLMLDIARHFHGPADIERVVDLMAGYKLSVLHLHLSDDQGWRIRIDAHPELTDVGAATEVGGTPGGFLTQDEYRGLVAYAAERGITVVPEIDMPGHTNAALVSLPWLTCDGEAPEPYTGMQVGFSSVCVDSEATYEWVDTVVGEIAAMTPGPYIHIGGDESHSTDADGYRRFVARAAEIVRSHGKIPVGWEEIGQAELGGEAVVQHWSDPVKATVGAQQGADVVVSPAPVAYLDMKLFPGMVGNDWAGMIDTPTGYGWEPAARLPEVDGAQILGVEAPLWTEFVTDTDLMGQLLLPRLPGYAELGWAGAPASGGFDGYAPRLAAHAARWEAAGWTFTRDPAVPWSGDG